MTITVEISVLLVITTLLVIKSGDCQNVDEQVEEYDNIQEVVANLSRIYEDPTKYTHRQLLETGILYLDKLLFLEDEVKAGTLKAERYAMPIQFK